MSSSNHSVSGPTADAFTTPLYSSSDRCNCQWRRKCHRSGAALFGLALLVEDGHWIWHEPHCPYHTGRSSHQSISVSMQVRRFLGRKITATLEFAYSGGGYSISPNLTFVAVVDFSRHGAFRFVLDFDCVAREKELSPQEIESFVTSGLTRLVAKVKEGQMSLGGVDNLFGSNLLEFLFLASIQT